MMPWNSNNLLAVCEMFSMYHMVILFIWAACTVLDWVFRYFLIKLHQYPFYWKMLQQVACFLFLLLHVAYCIMKRGRWAFPPAIKDMFQEVGYLSNILKFSTPPLSPPSVVIALAESVHWEAPCGFLKQLILFFKEIHFVSDGGNFSTHTTWPNLCGINELSYHLQQQSELLQRSSKLADARKP